MGMRTQQVLSVKDAVLPVTQIETVQEVEAVYL